MVMKEHVSQCFSGALDVFLMFLDNNGALWHRHIGYISLWIHAQHLSVGSIHCLVLHMGFIDKRKNKEYHQTYPLMCMDAGSCFWCPVIGVSSQVRFIYR